MSQITTFAPTRRLISAQVAAVLEKEADAPAVGIRAEAPSDLGDVLQVGGRELPVACCESVLEVRERLAGLGASEGPLVIVTTLEDRELGFDVLARLAKRRLFPIDPWQLVKERFRAQYVDARIVERHPWVARAILDAPVEAIFPPAPSGFLDAETVWRFLFEQVLRVRNGRRDAESILEWSLVSANVHLLSQLPEEYRTGFLGSFDPATPEGAVFGALTKGNNAHPLAIGLAARVVFDDSADPVLAAGAAARLEKFLVKPLTPAVALGWADGAEAVLERKLSLGLEEARPWLDAGEAVLREIQAQELALTSRYLLSSWEGRLDAFGEALETAVASGNATGIDETSLAADRVFDHALAKHSGKRMERMRMALRLLRWLEAKKSGKSASAFAEAAQSYRDEGGHVDWARTAVWEGDARPVVARAYSTLAARVTERREAENQRFGTLLAKWSQAGAFGNQTIPVERVLEQMVVPLVKACPALLVVIDGMGVPVFRELFDDVLRYGFTERVPVSDPERRPVISALPTVTELSRTSLLCGKLVSGNQATEKEGFGSHSELLRVSKPGKPPLLFHKGDLQDAGSRKLAEKLRSAIFDDDQMVVGVVINAVDDHLAKGDQVRVSWNCHTIRPLEELVEAARDAERAVILVSDHGHIPERDLVYRPVAGERERWRDSTGKPEADEVLLEGPRVLAGTDGRIIAPWSEGVRYAVKKNGYHGGASPQEVVIPLAVVAPASVPELDGWVEVPAELPSWWTDEKVTAPVPSKPTSRKPRGADKRQIELFHAAETWVEGLFASDTFKTQRELNKRVRLEDERIRQILTSLDERGKLTRAALAQRLEVPSLRLPGILDALRRVLNVDGYEVIAVDESSDTVTLNRDLLFRQFELGGE
jgi:hypothetical protein